MIRTEGIDLLEVARSAGVELRRSGNRHVGLCPIHSEKTPSFFVFPGNRWKCFGCGESGDPVDFIQKVHGLSFKDALTYLGLDHGPVTPETRKQIEDRKRRAALVKRFRIWEMKRADQAGTLLRCVHKIAATWTGPADLEANGEILELIAINGYELSILCSGDDGRKYELYQEATKWKKRNSV